MFVGVGGEFGGVTLFSLLLLTYPHSASSDDHTSTPGLANSQDFFGSYIDRRVLTCSKLTRKTTVRFRPD